MRLNRFDDLFYTPQSRQQYYLLALQVLLPNWFDNHPEKGLDHLRVHENLAGQMMGVRMVIAGAVEIDNRAGLPVKRNLGCNGVDP